jgi:phosphoglucomutase
MSRHTIEIRPTKPFTDQKPGTSGLRKPTKTFKKDQYFENFIQAYFDDLNETNQNKQTTLVVGGDGRHFVREGTRIIIQMAAANNVGRFSLKINSFFLIFFRLKSYSLHEMD